MSRWRPAVDEERWLSLASRYAYLREAVLGGPFTGGWKSTRPRSRIGFFLLGLFASTQAQGLLALLWQSLSGTAPYEASHVGLVTGVLTLGVAEWLIVRRRLFRSGLEEGLWLGGIEALCADLVPRFIEQHEALVLAVPAVALLLGGLRLLNPLGVTVAALLSSGVVAALLGHPWMAPGTGLASLYCLGIALLALGFGKRSFARPAHDAMVDHLVIVMPLAAFGWALAASSASSAAFSVQQLSGPWYPTLLPVLVPLVAAIACFFTGLWRRTHAPLVAALACKLCLAFELRELTGLPLRWRLLLWGALALLACLLLDRWLRTPRGGITTADLGDETAPLMPDVARAAALTPLSEPVSPPTYTGQGGGFGGGGASGRY